MQQHQQAHDGWTVFFENQFHQHHAHSPHYPDSSYKTAPSMGQYMNRASLNSLQAFSSPSLDLLPPQQPSLRQQRQSAEVASPGQSQGFGQHPINATANHASPLRWLNTSLAEDGNRRLWTSWKTPARANVSSLTDPFSSADLLPAVAEPLVEATAQSDAALIHNQPGSVVIENAICTTPCIIRKNKTLPPPTLSPILPTVISDPASLVSSEVDDDDSSSTSSWSTVESAWSTSASSDVDCNGWPRMDKYFFPDHCCRTSNCYSKAAAKAAMNGMTSTNEGKEDDLDGATPTLPSLPRSAKERRRSFGSELPPPTKICQHMRGSDPTHLSALSDSIWGVGWHQVQPLPPCFVACMQDASGATKGGSHNGGTKGGNQHCKRVMSHNGCCKGGKQVAAGNSTGTASNRKGANQAPNKKGGKHAKAVAETSSSKTLLAATMCRLPRSLQFID
ncbi:hypothetical protein BGZ73_004430 [Actinomortierella ambigua]|nr:hypothetical protein BGZ73_004430 [Actinomortierella ambigua]